MRNGFWLRVRQLLGAGKEQAPAPKASTRPLAQVLRVIEVADATALAGALFQRKFGHPIPDYPRHFVLRYQRGDGTTETLGYVHYLAFEDAWLCGGMCVDAMAQRRMPGEHLRELRALGGLAEHILRESFAQLGSCSAIFGHVGDPASRIVVLRAGFVDTTAPFLMAVWRDAPMDARESLVARAAALGPF